MKEIILNFLLITLILPSFCITKQDTTLTIKVLDKQALPIPGVILLQLPESYLIGSTDENGILQISLDTNLSHKQIKCQHISYQNHTISWEELKKKPTIILQEKVNELPETIVKAHPLPYLINSIHPILHKKYKAKKNYVRYHATASYSKAVENKGRTSQLRHEYGLFITSGDNHLNDKWDLNYLSCFIPKYSARSFDLTSDGKDTLKYSYLLGVQLFPEKEYNAYEVHIFKIMRAIYLYGPLFHNPQNFNFKLVDVDNTYYTFEFSTKPTCYPQKTKLLCRGIAKINRQCLRLKSLDFEYLDYQLFTLQRSDSQKPPYVTKAYVEFDYDQENHAYISYCATETIWKYITNYQSGTFAVEHPSRPFAAQNHLVEREIWKCSIYTPIPEKLRTKETAIQAQYANCSWGIYKPELLKKYPNPFANEQAIEDLNKYMPLEQQYRHNSKKFYQYYNGINLDPQYSLIQEAKRILLNLFAIQE